MNIASTIINAAAIPTRTHPDTTTQQEVVFSLSSRKGGEEADLIGTPSPRLHSFLVERGSKFLGALTRCAILTGQSNRPPSRAHPSPLRGERVPVGRVRSTWHVSEFLHGYIAKHFACASVFVRRAPAFAPLHRFNNCLMAEASGRME